MKTTSKPAVTVITVCRNALGMLRKTMESVEAQLYENLEYLVIDGASTDGTPQLLADWRGRLTRFVSEPDGGIYDAMNKGAAMATGEWLIFMNAGDTFASPDVLSRVFAEDRSQEDVIYGDVVKGGQVKPSEAPHNAHRMYFCHQSSLVRRTVFADFPFDAHHRQSADFKQMKQLWLSGKHFCQLHFPVADFDTTGISNTLRSAGLMDNIRVVREVDAPMEQLRLLPRLCFTWLMCRVRGK
ncbi:MAG: glycosyltransferase [Prevotella sp.]|nr:glycosyltransferase [Prevotella sp.]